MPPWLVGVLGLFLGSYLNAAALRYGTGRSSVFARSHCPHCRHPLGPGDLLPVLSYLSAGGRCRYCRARLSLRYPLAELATGAIFFLVALRAGLSLSSSFSEFFSLAHILTVFALLVFIALHDARDQVIPEGPVWTFNLLALLSTFALPHFLSGLALAAFFAGLWFFSRGRWMGFGDAKLALGVGWLLGPERSVLALLLAFWLGTLFALFLLTFRPGRYGLKSRVAFGPFLALAAFIAYLSGSTIMGWYLG